MTPVVRGIVIGRESVDTALVRLASEAEARALLDGPKDVTVMPAGDIVGLPIVDLMAGGRGIGGRVFVELNGKFVEAGRVVDLDARAGTVETTAMGDAFRNFIPDGSITIRGTFEGRIRW